MGIAESYLRSSVEILRIESSLSPVGQVRHPSLLKRLFAESEIVGIYALREGSISLWADSALESGPAPGIWAASRLP